MFDFDLGGLFTGPVGAIEKVADEKLKRSMEAVAVSFGYSQYITFFATMGKSLEGKRFLGVFSKPFISMAVSAYKMLSLQQQEKIIELSVPAWLNDPKIEDSIYWAEIKQK